MLQNITHKATRSPKRLFLIDGLGALLSALLLGVVLVQSQRLFGMPIQKLYILSFIAIIFTAYDFSCYLISPKNWTLFIRIIAFSNLIYVCLSAGLVIYFFQEMAVLGILYFVLEILVLLVLVSFELKVAKKLAKKNKYD